jgi:uncharacterized lipoprotein NlpE involved in copper resistance
MTVMVIFGLSFCFPIRGLDKDHNSRNCLNWEGVYVGTIPWASERINVRLQLNTDHSFVLEYEYLDRLEEPINCFPGSFQWNNTGNMIIIEMIDTVTHYKVCENILIRLDEDGNTLVGKLGYNYVLMKKI